MEITKEVVLLLEILAVLLSTFQLVYPETYKWVDENKTIHFTDDYGNIPEKYRSRVKKINEWGEKTPEKVNSRQDAFQSPYSPETKGMRHPLRNPAIGQATGDINSFIKLEQREDGLGLGQQLESQESERQTGKTFGYTEINTNSRGYIDICTEREKACEIG